MSTDTIVSDELRTIALDDIEVRQGFNPRTEIQRKELDELVRSVRARGVAIPVTVRRATNADATARGFVLIAGERRYRACELAGETDTPAIIKAPNGVGDLTLAMLENKHRRDLNPVDEAKGYQRLIEEEPETGGTRKGLAKFLGDPLTRINERLQILELPEELHPQIARGEVPLGAVKALLTLAKIHPGLPAVAVDRVLETPPMAWMQDITWADLIEHPISVVGSQAGDQDDELPDGVFENSRYYEIDRFVVSEKASNDLVNLGKLRGFEPSDYQFSFDREACDQAHALSAGFASEEEHDFLIVGQDVADQIVGDMIARQLKDARRHVRNANNNADAPDSQDNPAEQSPHVQAGTEERKREREEAKERRRNATAHNLELGIAIVKSFAKIKLDLRVVRILATINIGSEIDKIAMRGARYGFPGWTEEVATRGGKSSKMVYVDSGNACAEKIRGQLGNVKTPAELAGRLIGLVVMARFADEAAVAESNRSFYRMPIPAQLGWGTELIDTIDELAAERLPDHLTAAKRTERAEQRKAHQERLTVVNSINDRLDRAAALSVEERATLRNDIESAWPEWSLQQTEAIGALDAIEEQLQQGDAGDDNAVEQPGAEEVAELAVA